MKIKSQEEKESPPTEEKETDLLFFPNLNDLSSDSRTIHLYGEVDEENSRNLISALYYLKANKKTDEGEDILPIDVLVSTEGGSVQEMFSIYDSIRDLKREVEIKTYGIGKVMSAGILLLACGTSGSRRVGRNCRLMLHSVSGGQFGSLKELEVDLREVQWYENQFIKSLSNETKLKEEEIKEIFDRKTDTYFDAEQALEWGIVDEII
mgnify:CR=1 FL=1|jgi:ATP-dependent Clp protease, protease subunit